MRSFDGLLDEVRIVDQALDAGTITFMPGGGNYLPDDIDAEGLFAFEGEELVLQELWLGSSQGSMDPPGCGHRFAK